MDIADISFPGGAIENRPIDWVIPYEGNAKTHPADQVEQVARSIREFGWTLPLLCSDAGLLIAGHCRLLAARTLGLKTVPVLSVTGWTDEQIQLYRIADNRLAESPWDTAALAADLRKLGEAGADLTLAGLSSSELRDLLERASQSEMAADELPPPPPPTTQLGDVWILESAFGLTHRVICGDSTDPNIVAGVLGDVRPLVMVTEPPHDVRYEPSWRNKKRHSHHRAEGVGANDEGPNWQEAWGLFPGTVAYVWHAALHVVAVQESLVASGLMPRASIVWVKNKAVSSRGPYQWQHESVTYASRGECDGWQERFIDDHEEATYAVRSHEKGEWQGGRKESTVWFIDRPPPNKTGHALQKPVECMARPIRNNSSPGQAVYDPFLGSGTTLIAGEMTGRSIYGIELNPAYVDLAVARWCQFTGRVARRERDGMTWDGETCDDSERSDE